MKKILLVEDEIVTYMDVSSRVKDIGFEILDFSDNTEKAIEQTLIENPDLVLMDVKIKGQHDGLFTAKIISEEMNIPVIFFTSNTDVDTLNQISKIGHYGIIKKPFEEKELLEKIDNCKEIKKINKFSEKRTTLLKHKEIVLISRNLFAESNETIFHTFRVCILAKEVAREMNLGKNFIKNLGKSALLHDIGKQRIPTGILNKEEKLTDQDWLEIKKHSIYGYNILVNIKDFKHLAKVVLHHHERWDGKGYPYRLKGEEIPLASRIISIVDSYDAMTHNRVYGNKKSKDEALDEILKEKGKQFDPYIVDEFIKYINK